MSSALPDLDTPALVVDLDTLEENIRRMARLASRSGVRLRPHTKTHKSPAIARKQLASGAAGITVAKLSEAEVMVDAGVTDILVAYPIVGERKLSRLAGLVRRADITVSLDSMVVAEGIARVGRETGRTIPVYLELDTGLGRVGLLPGDSLLELGRAAGRLTGIEVCGVMEHAGHIAQAATRQEAAEIGRAAAEALVRTAEDLRRLGLDIRNVSAGSTPAAGYQAAVEGVTELRPGTYVFGDVNTVARWAASWDDCAAYVLSTVVSRPAPDRAVIDAGSKALSGAASLHPDVPGHGYVRNHPELVVERLSEEHGVVRLPAPSPQPAIGDRLEVIPNHVCTAVNLTDTLYGLRSGELEELFPVQGRGCSQ